MNQKMKIKKTISILLIFPLLLAISSCSRSNNYENSIAVVDDIPISQSLYTKELKFYQNFYTKKYGENYLDQEIKKGVTNNDILQNELIDSLIKDQIMVNDLNNNNVKLDDTKASNLRSSMEDELGGKDSLKANITAINLSENDFAEILYRDSIRKQHYDYYLTHNKVKDSDILDYYKKNKKYQRMYKYDLLIFDEESEAIKTRSRIKSSDDFNDYVNKKVKNYKAIKSDFKYIDDPYLSLAKVNKKDEVSEVFQADDKYMILMLNSYNENENDLLINLKDMYLRESYEKYLNNLTKKSKIRLFV